MKVPVAYMYMYTYMYFHRIRKITGLQTLLKLDVLDLHGNMVSVGVC